MFGFGARARTAQAPTLSPYRETPRDKLANLFLRVAGDSYQSRDMARNLFGSSGIGGGTANGAPALMDWTPAGIPFALNEAGAKMGSGRPLSGLADAALAVVPIPAAAKGLGIMAKRTVKAAAPKGITAYHGSPHTFDRFDTAKIGTGEGAQVYGHGLYFTEEEKTAQAYRDALRGKDTIPAMNQRMSELAREMQQYEVPGQYGKYRDQRGYDLRAEYDALMDARDNEKGSMYQVRINADPEHFLDWDKPLTQQHDTVKAALADAFGAEAVGIPARRADLGGGLTAASPPPRVYRRLPPRTGQEAYHALGPRSDASSELQKAGIPGIKYLDQGSRAAGDGSRNFVVFDPKIISIMKRYGVAAPVAAAMLAGGTPDRTEAAPARRLGFGQ